MTTIRQQTAYRRLSASELKERADRADMIVAVACVVICLVYSLLCYSGAV